MHIASGTAARRRVGSGERATPPSHRAGFTLVELVVVLMVLSILAALAVPRLAGMVNWTRLDRSAQQLSGDIAYARTVAVRAAERVTVEFTPTGYRLLRGSGAEVVKRVELASEHAGMSLVLESAVGAEGAVLGVLVFDSRGVLRQGGGTRIRLMREGRDAVLDLSATGRVQRAS